MKSHFIKTVLFVLMVVIPAVFFTKLLSPKYAYESVEGRLIEGYYHASKGHEVIFIGDCEVYESFVPAVLWEQYGIPSYIRGSAQQLAWQSFYLLEETLKYEKPKVVVFNVLALKYNTPQREAYNRLTLDAMKWSSSKVKAINASMLKEEQLITYVFPLLRYHSRWKELKEEDWTYMFKKPNYFHNGYYINVGVQPLEELPVKKPLEQEDFGEKAYEYLDKMVTLCEKNDIELILIKAPTLYPHWYDAWDRNMETYAFENGISYVNFLDSENNVMDYDKDTYDGGLHLNVYGAEKLTLAFGDYLKKNYDFIDHRENPHMQRLWSQKIARYYEMKQRLEDEYSKYGEMRMYQRP